MLKDPCYLRALPRRSATVLAYQGVPIERVSGQGPQEGSKRTPETMHEAHNEARGGDLGVVVRPREPPKGGMRATKSHFGELAS